MKHPILLIAASIVLLTACQSSQPALGPNGAEQLSNIHHLCILENAKIQSNTQPANCPISDKIRHQQRNRRCNIQPQTPVRAGVSL